MTSRCDGLIDDAFRAALSDESETAAALEVDMTRLKSARFANRRDIQGNQSKAHLKWSSFHLR